MRSEEIKPLVSVIIPFYNEEQFLPEAVESVLSQTYSHWELILVDDGSVNRSSDIARTYATQHPEKILYVEHPNHANKGAAASRNEGIKASKGPLITFLDADDIWLPNKLQEQVALHLQHPEVGLLVEASVYWNSWTGNSLPDITVPVGAPAGQVYLPSELSQVLYPLGKGTAPSPCSWMLTRAAIERSGGFEPIFRGAYQLYEDQAFLSKVYLQEQVFISAAANNLYRQRPDSCVASVNNNGKYHLVRLFFLNWLDTYLKEKNINNPAVNRKLRKALAPYRNPKRHRLAKSVWNGIYVIGKRVLPASIKNIIRK